MKNLLCIYMYIYVYIYLYIVRKFSSTYKITLPETNCLPLKIVGWKIIFSFWGPARFQGRPLVIQLSRVKCQGVALDFC